VFGHCKCYTHKALEYRLSSLGPGGRWFNCSKFANTTTANRSRGESLESIIPFRRWSWVPSPPHGLMVPYVLESSVQGAKQSHKMTIENVVVKPKLEHSLFTVPKIK